MNDNKLSTRQNGIDMSLSKISRIAGALFLLSLIVPILNWSFVLSSFISTESTIATTQNIIANETFFRFSIFNEVLTAIVVLSFSAILYILLKATNRNLALLAFSVRFIEVILILTLAIGHYTILLIVKGESYLSLTQQELLYTTVGLILKEHVQLTAIHGIFFGLSMVIYSYLFFISKLIPVKWALFGIISYLLIFIYDTLTVLFPNYADIILIQIICTLPMCIFHLKMGICLLLKGVQINNNINKLKTHIL